MIVDLRMISVYRRLESIMTVFEISSIGVHVSIYSWGNMYYLA